MIQDTLQRLRGQQPLRVSESTTTVIELGDAQMQAINEVLMALDQSAPRKAIGLFGARGSGKSLMLSELAKDGIRALRTPQHRKVVCAVVNAANLPTDLAPWQRLIFATLDKLAQQPGASPTINDLRAELEELVEHEANNDDSATLAAAAFAHHFRAAFAGLVHSGVTLSNATFVVAMDHIDKASSENAAQLLEASKYFLNAQNCATLICTDEAALVTLLGDDGHSTLSKWLTVQINLPSIDVASVVKPQPVKAESAVTSPPVSPKPIASDIPPACVQILTDALGSDRYTIERAGDYWRSAMRALARRNADGYHTNVNGAMIAKLCAMRVLSPSLFDAVRFDAPLLVTLERRARSAGVTEVHDEWAEALARDARLAALFKAMPSFIGVETRDLATALRLVQTGDSEMTQPQLLAVNAKPVRNRALVIGAPTTPTSPPDVAPVTVPRVRPRRESQPASLPSALWMMVSLAAGVFILDRLIKLLVQSGAPILGGFMQLQLPTAGSLLNHGLALGAELVGLALCALIVIFSAKHTSTVRSAAFGLIVGGLAANLFDRVAYGWVMNYLHVGNLPIFNLAHAALVGGAALLAVAIVMGKSDRNTEREPFTA